MHATVVIKPWDRITVRQLKSQLRQAEWQVSGTPSRSRHYVACSQVRLLGVYISSDLSLEHHVSRICVGCYHRLRELRRLQRSMDSDSLATFDYAVVNSRIDYCNTILAGAPRTVTDTLQRVLNEAARVVTGTRKFDLGLGQILHEELHWLDVPDRAIFKLAVLVHRCLNGRTPPYLSDYCIPVASAVSRQHLRSANRQLYL